MLLIECTWEKEQCRNISGWRGPSCRLRVGAAQAVAQENEAWAIRGTGVVFIANGKRGSAAA